METSVPAAANGGAAQTVPSICRNCLAYCPILVTVEDGRAVKVTGDPAAPLFNGYSCPKGRALPAQHSDPHRVLRCLKRQPDGSFAPLPADEAIGAIAAKLQDIIARHGPGAVAAYSGTVGVPHPLGMPMLRALFRALGSNLVFSAQSIDKPGANTSLAFHGNWQAGAQAFEDSDTWMIVGANPVIARSNGVPVQNPAQRLKDAQARGMKLIVIDPRRTETARRAHVHLQLIPGEDPTLLAGLIHIIIAEGLHDAAFVADNATGFEELKAAVASYTPEYVAQRAGVAVADLLEAARTFGRAKRGSVVCSTGPSFSTHSNLAFYLALCLNTLCGRWARAGDRATHSHVLLLPNVPRAQPWAPFPVFGKTRFRTRNFRENASGLPATAIADEILTEGEGQIRALICHGSNPLLAWPDQARAAAAMDKLELLVVHDIVMTPTAEKAHYVIPSPMIFEVPGSTQKVEWLKYIGVSRGYEIPWAQYTPQIVPHPPASDLVEDTALFFRIAQKLGLQLDWTSTFGLGPHVERPPLTVKLDMARVPTVDELIELTCEGSVVPLDEVKKHPHGQVFEQANVRVLPRDPACTAMLDLAAPMMIDELREVRASAPLAPAGFPYRLASRRINNFMNSVGQTIDVLHGGQLHTPGYMHPDDMAAQGIGAGEVVRVVSPTGAIEVRMDPDPTLRPGVLSVIHGFGIRLADGRFDPRFVAGSVTRLVGLDEADPITGIPRMSAIPVRVERAVQ